MEKEYKDIQDAVRDNNTYDIEGVEIFKAGTWNGDKYSNDDLDEMEQSFNEIGATVKPYLKLGHNKDQKLLASDGMPAAGWVTNVRRKGDSLLADFKGMPKKIYQLIDKKAYGRMSSEIYWNLKANDKTHKRVLKAVALLGANTPAVTTLDDFINLYTEDESEFEDIKQYHIIEDTLMDEKIYQDKIHDLETKLVKYSDIEAENTTLKAEIKEYTDKLDVLEAEKAKMYTEQKAEKVRLYIEAKVREGKILPSQVEMYTKLAAEEKIYTIDEKEMSALDMVASIVDANAVQMDFSETSEKSDEELKNQDKDVEIEKKIKEYEEKHGVSYKEAYAIVGQEV